MINGLIDSLIQTELAEIGYSPGDGRVKYFAGIYPRTQLTAWCLIFQIYCMVKTFGEKHARRLMFAQNHWMYFVSALALRYQEHGLVGDYPRKGDFAFFKDEHGIFNHIGLITEVKTDGFYSIEGNVDDSVKEIFHPFDDASSVMYARPPYWSITDDPGTWIKENGILRYEFQDGTIPRNGWYAIDGKKYTFGQYGEVVSEEDFKL